LVKRPRSINLDDLDTSGEEVPHPALVTKAKWKLDMDDDNGEPQKKEVDVSRKKGMKREFFWNQAYTAIFENWVILNKKGFFACPDFNSSVNRLYRH